MSYTSLLKTVKAQVNQKQVYMMQLFSPIVMLLCICFRKWNCRSEISLYCIYIIFGHAQYFL